MNNFVFFFMEWFPWNNFYLGVILKLKKVIPVSRPRNIPAEIPNQILGILNKSLEIFSKKSSKVLLNGFLEKFLNEFPKEFRKKFLDKFL